MEHSTIYDVIIIGAGLSGLYAGSILQQYGCGNFVLLEARDRVGGRTFTKKSSDVGYVDLGASYVGPTQSYVHNLIKKFNLKTYKVYDSGSSVYIGKKHRVVHSCDENPRLGLLADHDVRQTLKLIEQMCDWIPVEEPWKAPQAYEWDRITFAQFLERNCWTNEARDFLDSYIACSTSCEAYEASLLWTLWFIKQCGGLRSMYNIANSAQEQKIVGGTLQISEQLQQLIGEDRVWLRKAVAQIHKSTTSGSIVVSTVDGDRLQCKTVIMAIPISLQQKIHFSPPLPPMYQQLMQKMPMGSTIKCIVYYRKAFWRQQSYSGNILTNGPVWLDPIMLTLDDTKPDGTYPAIVGFIIGERAKHLVEKSKSERLKLICECYSNAFDSPLALEPVHYEEKCWMSEPYSGGCFTAFGIPGFLTTYGQLLRKPLLEDIYLAGTETATRWSGYMDGALQAGERAAFEVLERLQLKKKPTIMASVPSDKSIVSHQSIALGQLITWLTLLLLLIGFLIESMF